MNSNKNNIYIDESGIHKKIDNSTFVLVYVESENVEKLEDEICKLEEKLNIQYFHWSETVWKVKEKFLDMALSFTYKVKVAVVKNPVNPSKEMVRLLTHLIVERNIGTVFIDGQKPKWYERVLKGVLRSKGISVGKLKTVKAEKVPIIRLADMVAGLVRSHYDDLNSPRFQKYYSRLEKKIEILVK
ncbi:MAG: hypothetical protein ACD_72C00317G0002 [uncultured bacterium]|nr:MAG: hypothetical protein ACD_72C00317G0002 [uncultured bacterium]